MLPQHLPSLLDLVRRQTVQNQNTDDCPVYSIQALSEVVTREYTIHLHKVTRGLGWKHVSADGDTAI